MSEKPFISVVIPTFNRASQVQAAVKSVLAQTYREFEVIVVDDGSTDGTKSIFQRFLSENNAANQVRYMFQPNQGQSAARNKGVEAARGEWIAFLDSDDTWFPEKLELQMKALERFEGKSWACITDARWVDDLGMDTTAFCRSGRHYLGTWGRHYFRFFRAWLAKKRSSRCRVSTGNAANGGGSHRACSAGEKRPPFPRPMPPWWSRTRCRTISVNSTTATQSTSPTEPHSRPNASQND